jgi:HD-GYP domain-containing protein (c-di-GMP phosphodiesterase class II)
MQYSPLSAVKQRIQVGKPLPFNIRDNDATLLLARGQVVGTEGQMQALFARGALVDLAELQTAADVARQVSRGELQGMWSDALNKMSQTLLNSGREGFLGALEEAAPPVLDLIERDKDLAIFQVLRQDQNEFVQYGVNHSSHAAITAFLVAQRLGWSSDDAIKVFKASLTMNISMLELQGQLAVQTTPPTAEQRTAIRAHPDASRRMLEISGVTDLDWLQAVSQHHEAPDGSGYPRGLHASHDLAELVRRADIYTAKLSPRANRDAIAADKAGRMMFMQDPGHPMTAALVKEFGVYPPGCFVKLMSGESGLVVKRGQTVMTPVVAVLTSPYGNNLPKPVRRDTSQREYAIHSVLGGTASRVKLTPELMMSVLTETA